MKNNNWIICISILIILLWIVSWIYVDLKFPSDAKNYVSDRGAFGDKFGFVNSIFSGAALAGIILSIFLQRHELSLQRKELIDTRNEFSEQNFQTTFFNLLKTQRQIIEEIDAEIWRLIDLDREVSERVNGRRFMVKSKREMTKLLRIIEKKKFVSYHPWDEEEYYSYYPSSPEDHDELVKSRQAGFTLKIYSVNKEKFNTISPKSSEEIMKFVYGSFLNRYHYTIGHYFRHFYHILVLLEERESEIQKTDSKKEQKEDIQKYSGFIQAQMSVPEMFLIYYNCSVFPKLKRLVVKYNILENLNKEDLIDISHADLVPEIHLKSRDRFINK